MADRGLEIISGIGFKENPSKARLRDKDNILVYVFAWDRFSLIP